MKRVIVFLLILFAFISCGLKHTQNWITAYIETDENTQLFYSNNPYHVYYKTKINTDLQINYCLLPDSDLQINNTDIIITSDENIIEIKSINYSSKTIYAHTKNIGNTKIYITTKYNGSTSLEIQTQ